jgi:hypothetical protein
LDADVPASSSSSSSSAALSVRFLFQTTISRWRPKPTTRNDANAAKCVPDAGRQSLFWVCKLRSKAGGDLTIRVDTQTKAIQSEESEAEDWRVGQNRNLWQMIGANDDKLPRKLGIQSQAYEQGGLNSDTAGKRGDNLPTRLMK